MAAETRIRLLLVDDDPDDALLARRALAELDGIPGVFEVVEAGSLAGALKALAGGTFDVVALDLTLPDSVGLATLEAVREAAPHTPVVVVTGLGNERLGAEAVRRGAQDYLVKGPESLPALRRAALYALTRARLGAQALAIERLNADVEERRRQAELKDRFFASAAHEVRSPVTVVRAALQTLQEGGAGALNPEQQYMVDMALRNALNLTRQLDDFLDVSRLEAGAVRTSLSDFDPAPTLAEAARGFGLVGARRGVVMALEVPASLPAVRADPAMFRRILANLLDNALRFARSRVQVGGRARADAGLEFWVEDDGPGIPPERLGSLFKRFSQADRAAADDGYRGTGLGLWLCKEMVELNGGSLTVASPPGSGTRFTFLIPAAQPCA